MIKLMVRYLNRLNLLKIVLHYYFHMYYPVHVRVADVLINPLDYYETLRLYSFFLRKKEHS